MTLADVVPGNSAHVERIHFEGAMKRKLLDMGVTRGTRITVVKTAPLGDPLEVKLRGYTLALRKSDAARIDVSVGDSSDISRVASLKDIASQTYGSFSKVSPRTDLADE